MNHPTDLEQRLGDHFAQEASTRAPDRVLDASLRTVQTTPQRRTVRVPWRFSPMFSTFKLALGAAVFALLLAGGGLLLAPRGSNQTGGSGPSASPGPSPVDTSGWQSFTSDRHGYSIKYPADWTASHASAPWLVTDPGDPDQPGSPAVDEFHPPKGPTVLIVTSQAIADGTDGDAWFAKNNTPPFSTCYPALADMESISVDGHAGKLNGSLPTCPFTNAVVTANGRAYYLTVFPTGWGGANAVYDRPLFDALLSTITFDAAAADDTPAASPSLAPFSADTTGWLPFTSNRYGYSVKYPADWTAKAGTEPTADVIAMGNFDTGEFGLPSNDHFGGTGPVAFTVTSGPAPEGASDDHFFLSYGARISHTWSTDCWPAVNGSPWDTSVIGGHPAHGQHEVAASCPFREALALVDGRLYAFVATPGTFDQPSGRALFDAFLSTVTFDPAAADDRPVAGPPA